MTVEFVDLQHQTIEMATLEGRIAGQKRWLRIAARSALEGLDSDERLEFLHELIDELSVDAEAVSLPSA